MPATIVIRAEGLGKQFGTLTALADFHLTVAAGESFALVGPDGAGKTTAIRILCGIMDPDHGQATILGYDTVKGAEQIKEQIGYMPQRFGLYDDLTVAENLHFYADIYRVPRAVRQQRVPELLRFANLERFQDRLAANLSGGMRQKLGLICTLVHHPRIIFLDEPTFGVDPVSRREFWQVLYRLLASGITIFLTTSYMDEAERVHRVGLMHRGRLLLTDTPRGIKDTFQGELVEVRNGNLLRARQILQEHPLVHQTLLMGDRLMLTVASGEAALGPLTQTLAAAGLSGLTLRLAGPSLEDVFVQVIRRQERLGTDQAARPHGASGGC